MSAVFILFLVKCFLMSFLTMWNNNDNNISYNKVFYVGLIKAHKYAHVDTLTQTE